MSRFHLIHLDSPFLQPRFKLVSVFLDLCTGCVYILMHARIAVSSAKVSIVVLFVDGRSECTIHIIVAQECCPVVCRKQCGSCLIFRHSLLFEIVGYSDMM